MDKEVKKAERGVLKVARKIYVAIEKDMPLDGGELSSLCQAYEDLMAARKARRAQKLPTA